ncbi:hypothetical protein [Streptomyces sp. NPDC001492]
MGRFTRIVGDVRRRQFLDAYTGWVLAVLVTGLQVFSGFSEGEDWIGVVVTATTVLLLGLVALATAEIRRQLTAAQESQLFRGGRLFTDRSQLPPLHTLLRDTHRSVEIYGVQLGHVVHHLLPVIADQARAGCHFRLALLTPVDGDGDKVPWIDELGTVHGFPNLEDVLRTNLVQLRHWYTGLTPKQQRNIEIRGYCHIPTASVMLFDVEQRTGFAHVEPILFAVPPAERPAFWAADTDNAKLFHLIVDQYRSLWQSATPLAHLPL